MKKHSLIVILFNLVLLLAYFIYAVAKKEQLLQEGHLVLLELAPVDPRSLMQGDYMTLRYRISDRSSEEEISKRGYCVVLLDSNRVASKVRFQEGPTPLREGEMLIEYTAADRWDISIGAESFFFQEGEASKYDEAKYGALKIDDAGNSILVGLYDEHLQEIL